MERVTIADLKGCMPRFTRKRKLNGRPKLEPPLKPLTMNYGEGCCVQSASPLDAYRGSGRHAKIRAVDLE